MFKPMILLLCLAGAANAQDGGVDVCNRDDDCVLKELGCGICGCCGDVPVVAMTCTKRDAEAYALACARAKVAEVEPTLPPQEPNCAACPKSSPGRKRVERRAACVKHVCVVK